MKFKMDPFIFLHQFVLRSQIQNLPFKSVLQATPSQTLYVVQSDRCTLFVIMSLGIMPHLVIVRDYVVQDYVILVYVLWYNVVLYTFGMSARGMTYLTFFKAKTEEQHEKS